jgi:DNA (cytosine-5)-methyltransferase 1
VRGFLSSGFAAYRQQIADRLNGLGYTVDWRLHDAQAFGVPQTRSRVTILAARTEIWSHLQWPDFTNRPTPNVGDVLHDLMAENGWHGVDTWAQTAKGVAPTIVGGSKKHGGPDLGPTRARAKWREMGVNGSSIADAAPEPDFVGLPRLTTRMVARLQGFPDDWHFTGRKTAAYRQIGNAFPPPVAQALGHAIAAALSAHDRDKATDCKVAAE